MTTLLTAPRIELLPLKAALPAGEDSELTVLARIHPATPAETGGPRLPLHLALVLDRSGSMSGLPLQMARQAAQVAIRQLQPQDRVSVVTFDTIVDTLIPSQPVTNPDALCREIERITTGAMTALHAGWLDGAMQVAQHINLQALNRVLLLSDGQANEGITDHGEIIRQVSGLSERGVSTSTIGLGVDYDEDLLRGMADAGDGNYEHIEDAEKLPAYFQAELSGLSLTSGHTVSLGLEPNPELGSLRQDVLNDLKRTDTGRWHLRNLTQNQSIEVVFTMHIPAQQLQTELGVTRVRLAWTGRDGIRRTQRAQLNLPVITPSAHAKLPENHAVQIALELGRNAQAKRDAVQFLDAGRVADAQAVLKARSGRFLSPGIYIDESIHSQEYDDLLDLEEKLQSDQQLARKRAVSQNYNQSNSKVRR